MSISNALPLLASQNYQQEQFQTEEQGAQPPSNYLPQALHIIHQTESPENTTPQTLSKLSRYTIIAQSKAELIKDPVRGKIEYVTDRLLGRDLFPPKIQSILEKMLSEHAIEQKQQKLIVLHDLLEYYGFDLDQFSDNSDFPFLHPDADDIFGYCSLGKQSAKELEEEIRDDLSFWSLPLPAVMRDAVVLSKVNGVCKFFLIAKTPVLCFGINQCKKSDNNQPVSFL